MAFTQIEKDTKSQKKTGLKGGVTTSIEELIEYGEDAVVSRTLVENDAGTVTLFAFDEGQGLSEHTAPFDALVQVVDGESEIIIGGTSNSVKKGELILMPANIPHALRAVKRFKMILTMLRKRPA
ncbi:MAG: cupin domain-containing protein [Deltaproteobacteria bacterium]|jgi:quercetin dioxygenase-like cupin family protein|nr:cupin domain-containing protein [Deltaproteobacteria bacterium]